MGYVEFYNNNSKTFYNNWFRVYYNLGGIKSMVEIIYMIALMMLLVMLISTIGVAIVYGIIALMVNLAKQMEER
tara:strand:- start:3280 stop:3501 length:222 start_codon:yes stop_codon:yes gene_type:complete